MTTISQLMLDEFQDTAVTAPIDRHILVTAPPGSGKTHTLVSRYLYLLACGIPCEQIAMVTFTNKAAAEMRHRIGQALQWPSNKLRLLQIATFHSLCARWLRQLAPAVGLRSNFTIYDEYTALQLFTQLRKELMGNDIDTPSDQHPDRELSRSAEFEIMNHEREAGLYVTETGPRHYIYREYEEALRQNNAVDFVGLIQHIIRLGHNGHDFRWPSYVLVDECQDINRIQCKLLEMFISKGAIIYMVGDINQSIYGWRGSCPDLVLEMAASHQAEGRQLVYNYRSCQNISRLASSIINDQSKPVKQQSGKVVWFEVNRTPYVPGIQARADFVAKLVAQMIASGKSPDSIAVLCRYSDPLSTIWGKMAKERIPAMVIRGRNIGPSPLLKVLSVYHNPADLHMLKLLLCCFAHLGPITADRICQRVSEIKDLKSALQCPVLLRHPLINAKMNKSIAALYAIIDHFDKVFDTSATLADALGEPVLNVYFDCILQSQRESPEQISLILDAASSFAATREDLQEFLNLFELTGHKHYNNVHVNEQAVRLMTIHGAKGLEFDTVVLFDTPLYGHQDGEEDPQQAEEEKRVFYVAVTRAIENLFIISPPQSLYGALQTTAHAMLRGSNIQPVALDNQFLIDLALVGATV